MANFIDAAGVEMQMKCLAVLIAWTSLSGQSLMILPAPPLRGGAGLCQIMIAFPAAVQRAAALQWRVSTLGGAILSVTVSSAAEEVGKSLVCAQPRDAQVAPGNVYRCILFGGGREISDGPVAVVRYKAAEDRNEVTLRIDEVLGATAKGEAIPFAEVGLTIGVRR